MRKQLLIQLFALLATLTACMHAGQSNKGDIEVFILIGQSNMVGTAREYQIKDPLPQARQDILYSYQLPRLPWKESSVDISSDGFVALDTYTKAGQRRWGPELTLGPALKDTYLDGQAIALIKFARGGSNLFADWDVDATKGAQLYSQSLEYIRAQLDALRQMGYNPELRGAFWFQGEGDSNKKLKNAEAYAQNLRDLIAAYRSELGLEQLPFVLARINPTKPSSIHAPIVRQAIVEVAESDPAADWVNTDDLTFPDRVHVDGYGQYTVGKRMAAKWAELAKR